MRVKHIKCLLLFLQNMNGDSKKTEEKTAKSSNGLGEKVAKHYNAIPAGTRQSRRESPIFHLKNFNNWVKSVIINDCLEKIRR